MILSRTDDEVLKRMYEDGYIYFIKIQTLNLKKNKEWKIPLPSPDPELYKESKKIFEKYLNNIKEICEDWLFSKYVVDRAFLYQKTKYEITIHEVFQPGKVVYFSLNRYFDRKYLLQGTTLQYDLQSKKLIQIAILKIKNPAQWTNFLVFKDKFFEIRKPFFLELKGNFFFDDNSYFSTYSYNEVLEKLSDKPQCIYFIAAKKDFEQYMENLKNCRQILPEVDQQERYHKILAKEKLNQSNYKCECYCECGTCHKLPCKYFYLNVKKEGLIPTLPFTLKDNERKRLKSKWYCVRRFPNKTKKYWYRAVLSKKFSNTPKGKSTYVNLKNGGVQLCTKFKPKKLKRRNIF